MQQHEQPPVSLELSDLGFVFLDIWQLFFFIWEFQFLSEHSMVYDLHFSALIIHSADQFACLEVQKDP